MKWNVTSCPQEISQGIAKWAYRVNLVSKKPVFFACPHIEFEDRSLKKAAFDLARLKDLICDIPRRMMLSKIEFVEQQGMSKNVLDFATNDPMSWQATIFRPDCILTREGLKVLEMNIDNGALALYGEMSAKTFLNLNPKLHRFWAQESLGGLDGVLQTMDSFAEYLKNKAQGGLKIYLWDLKGRSPDQESERTQVIESLRKRGLDVSLILSEEILSLPLESDIYVFRYFAYAHFFNQRQDLQEIFQKVPSGFFFQGELGISSALFDNKVNLAILRSQEFERHLTVEEHELIYRLIPETRKIDHQQAISPDVVAHKDQWIIKAGIGFQGKQVKYGSECSDGEWVECLREASGDKSSWTIQRRVYPVSMNIPVTNGQDWKNLGSGHILNFFFVGDQFAGTWMRISSSEGKIGVPDGIETVLALPRIVAG